VDTVEEDAALRPQAARVRLLYDYEPSSLLVNLMVAIALAAVQMQAVEQVRVAAWLSYVVVVSLARLSLTIAFRRMDPLAERYDRWGRLFLAGVVLAGLGWGGAGVLLFPPTSVAHQAFLELVVMGVSAAAIAVLAPMLAAVLSFLLLSLVPITAQFLLQPGELQFATGLLCLLFTTFMLMVARRSHATISNALSLRDENVHLVHFLRQAKWDAEGLNAGLRAEIVQREKVELALKKAKEDAEQASTAKGDFLATMSHEIRTPMHGVLGTLDLLRDMPMSDDQRELVNTAQSSAESLLTIINDILDLSKIEAGHLTLESIEFDLRRTVSEVAALMGKRAQAKDVQLNLTVLDRVPGTVVGDPTRFRQVFTNLVGNAVKFTDRGRIDVKVSVARAAAADMVVRVDVRDTGIGMTKDVQERLFHPFTQGDGAMARKYGGTGLGLSIAKRLVAMMGGRIGVQSEPGKGSNFWFTLRLGRPAGRQRPRRGDLRGARVLLVGDDARRWDGLVQLLRGWGVTCDLAASGPAALEKLHSSAHIGESWTYEATLLDGSAHGINMPELARRILADTALGAIPIVAIEPLGGQTGLAQELGIDLVLRTPVRGPDLFDLLASILPETSAMPSDLNAEMVPTGQHVEPLPAPWAKSEPASPGVASEGLAPRQPNRSGHILLVEDNAVNQKLAQTMLSRLGFRVSIANDGREALQRTGTEPYDVVLMDCQMPNMDGFEATAGIRRQEQAEGRRRVPIIALTANAMAGDRERCLEAGMDDYLPKPVKQHQLGATLDRWMAPTPGRQPLVAVPSIPPTGPGAVQAPNTAPPGRAAAQTGASGPSGRVLVVDDDALSRKVTKAMLDKLGLQVDLATGGAESVAATRDTLYDLVLMDCMMPGMDGLQACAAIRKREAADAGRRIPIVAMTGNTMPGDRERLLAAGMDGYLAKPVRRDILAEAVNKWLVRDPEPTAPPEKSPVTDAADPSPPAPPDIDQVVLGELREIMEEAFPDLVHTYLRDTPALIIAMRDGIRDGDANGLRLAAHTIKSSSANMGAAQVAALAKELESIGRAGTTEGAKPLLVKLFAEYVRVKQALETI
jgi:CheY-like chemotaxis protein/HPt (histidine-containing phosphotransfer) domain-containing protein